jgi:hypothetical protein
VQDLIKPGTILIKERTVLPTALGVEIATYAAGWQIVKNFDGYALGRTVHNAGWTFFCIGNEMTSIVWGFGREKSVRAGVARILREVAPKKFNSLEITEMASKHFCGIPYLTLAARSRHIQEGAIIFRPSDVPVLNLPVPASA